ncbi:hypothetical protein [Hydrotalea sandarakina]|jgi:hypothetical protein|uniref:Uncharacterized protein n=1 Tax=Hydrotalea sandarakina TaxID=1004304 RepID=A0A2W7RGM4_9BACT|nr:hypothetical protein [Hydrotalea sandarakina]PZX60093.1 hypothetical protein LX80_02662 [Hydrotalea sandarakina]
MLEQKKQMLIESFEKMNVSMLSVLLDDDKTYQDVPKELFVQKLEAVFETFQQNGDTCLTAHAGTCYSDSCPNAGCRGYAFVGNATNNHISLIFKDSAQEIEDIFHCGEFKTDDPFVRTNQKIRLEVWADEMAAFEPSVDFLILLQQAEKAYETLIQYRDDIIDKSIYLPWISKYASLYEMVKLQIMYSGFHRFNQLYGSISSLNEFLPYSVEAQQALEAYAEIDVQNEQQLLHWLTTYEPLGDHFIGFLYDEIDLEHPEAKAYFTTGGLKISTADFKYIALFKFYFDDYYWYKLDEYNTFTNEQLRNAYNPDDEISQYRSSLTYHLRKRNKLR